MNWSTNIRIFEYFHRNIFIFGNVCLISSRRIYSDICLLHFCFQKFKLDFFPQISAVILRVDMCQIADIKVSSESFLDHMSERGYKKPNIDRESWAKFVWHFHFCTILYSSACYKWKSNISKKHLKTSNEDFLILFEYSHYLDVV